MSTVEDPAGARIDEVVYNGEYLALGSRIEAGGAVVRAILWQSANGAQWTVKGSAQIGDCSGEGPACGHAEGLVATAAGLLILGNVHAAGKNAFFGALRSTDGSQWVQIERATFDGDLEAYIAAAIPFKDGVVALVGSGVRPMTAWRTVDGKAWEPFGRLGDRPQTIGDLATDGHLLVAAEGESAPEGFRTTMWTTTDSGQFERAGAFEGLILTKVAYAGTSGFAATGHDEGRPQVGASRDGRSWYRTAPGLPQVECAPRWLAGGTSTALYVGSCGVWIARAV